MPYPLPVIVHADAEAVVTSYLRTALADSGEPVAAGVAVSTRLPPGTSPTRHVRVRRVGGLSTLPVIDVARLDVQVWHTDDAARMQLAQLARGLLHAMEGAVQDGVRVYRVDDVLGPAVLPDPATDTRSVVMFTVQARLRGTQRA